MSGFANNYKQVVVPDLARYLEVAGAPCVALCVATFSEIMREAVSIAGRRGAAYLPSDIQDDLMDWIANKLFIAVNEFEEKNEEACAQARELWLGE